jgi:hypothetical protein
VLVWIFFTATDSSSNARCRWVVEVVMTGNKKDGVSDCWHESKLRAAVCATTEKIKIQCEWVETLPAKKCAAGSKSRASLR